MPEKKEEFPEPKNVYEAINHVMGRVGYVQKQDASGLPYTFAGEAAFIKAVRPHLVDAGLIVYQSGVELLEKAEFTSKKGALGINILARFFWTWVHAPSGTAITVTSLGEAADYGDKAANKSMTAGMKYNLRQTLVIETGDDPDKVPSSDYERDESTTATKVDVERIENQWEQPVLDKLIDLGLVSAKKHAVNTLEQSPFKSVPYGQLEIVEAVAYFIGRAKLKEEFPDIESKERATMMNEQWAKGHENWLDKAIEMLNVQKEE